MVKKYQGLPTHRLKLKHGMYVSVEFVFNCNVDFLNTLFARFHQTKWLSALGCGDRIFHIFDRSRFLDLTNSRCMITPSKQSRLSILQYIKHNTHASAYALCSSTQTQILSQATSGCIRHDVHTDVI